ncbi:uncharacterized protein PRCAT00004286001 [Priceomyces carsonii]|uniref:uncharacterized protein n=1 Tax=Priceomyces carsonii TaxID=28549 RepID=UPI002ED84561|nr:unnamed protein product [Priceomyces carsonii]
MTLEKPLVIHLNPVRFAHNSWEELKNIAEVILIDNYSREEFITDLHGKYSNVVAIGRGYLTGHKVGLFDEELVSHFPKTLKYISHQGAGYDQCHIKPITDKGIQVSNCPNVISKSTADTNLFLLLGAMRNFDEGRRRLLNGEWPKGGFGAGAKVGLNPKSKILGIVGMGSIGRAFRDRCESLGFKKIIYYNRKKLPAKEEGTSEYVSSIEKLITISDVISINCPLNQSTHHLIDDSMIRLMKDGVIIINTARGEIIDEKSMINSLKNGKIGAVGLDVFENEPHVSEELLSLPNVVALPHMGTHAMQTILEMEELVVENIRSGLTTGNVLNRIPEQRSIAFG